MKMERVTLLDNESAVVWYYPMHGLVHHQFRQVVTGKPFQAILLTGLKALKNNSGASKWLSDDRANSNLSMEDNAWSSDFWRPQAVAAGWKTWAIVLPIRTLGRININRIGNEVAIRGITVQFFSDPDEAFAWVINQ
jgi:hypothetical protein